jgi:hypothetical protein
MYFRFSSSFICSARSSCGGGITVFVGAAAFDTGLGVLLDDVLADDRFLSGDPSFSFCVDSATCVTTGESAILGSCVGDVRRGS